MSTAAQATVGHDPAPRRTADAAVTPLGFGRLLAVELRKLVDTVAGRWVLGGILLVTLAALALMWFVAPAPERTFGLFLQAVFLPQGVLLPVLGILAATQEWTQRTGLVTFTLEPRRVRVVVAKLVAALLLGLVGVAAGVALAAILTLAASAGGGGIDRWSVEAWPAVGNVAALLLNLLTGVGFGLLIPVTWLAVVAYYLLPTVLSALSIWGPMEKIVPWIDLGSATAPLTSGEALTATQWQQLAATIGLWVVLPAVVGTVLTLRREVK